MHASSTDHELHKVSRRYDLLQHPFYKRWLAGELTHQELENYTGQYAHVVRAIPRWLAGSAARDNKNATWLALHAMEEADHVALWERFAAALGIDKTSLPAIPPNRATQALIAACDDLVDAGHGAAVVWSIEAQSPAVSAEKLRGLKAHYGIDENSGGEYFALHESLDREHEAQLRRVISGQPPFVRRAAPAAAATALEAMWKLLSSVERCSATIS